MTERVPVGIIGGSGLYDIEGLEVLETVTVETPFGAPSAPITIGELSGHRVAFLPRHGKHHEFHPSVVPYRANIWALKKLGVFWTIAVNAVGRPVDIGFDDTVDPGPPVRVPLGADGDLRANTTIGVIVTDAVADAGLCQLLAQSGHDGFARALFPAHTQADGDALVAAATGQVEVDPFHLRVLAQQAVTAAIRTLA